MLIRSKVSQDFRFHARPGTHTASLSANRAFPMIFALTASYPVVEEVRSQDLIHEGFFRLTFHNDE